MMIKALSVHEEPIAVSVCCRDPLVRAGVGALMAGHTSLRVRVMERAQLMQSTRPWDAFNVQVVIADYETALAIAGALKREAPLRTAPSIKVMIVTARDGEVDVRRALEIGIQGYLALDCHPDEIIDGVIALHRGQRCLGRSVAQRMADSLVYEALTKRERDVLSLIVSGDANKTVARKLNIALGTVKVHVRSIMSKLGARTRTEAAAVARRRGLCVPESEPAEHLQRAGDGCRLQSSEWLNQWRAFGAREDRVSQIT
jgi:DNA-binding NarL/FixJ family response regulator